MNIYYLVRKNNMNLKLIKHNEKDRLTLPGKEYLISFLFYLFIILSTEGWKYPAYINTLGKYPHNIVQDRKHSGRQQYMKALKSQKRYRMIHANLNLFCLQFYFLINYEYIYKCKDMHFNLLSLLLLIIFWLCHY